MAFPHTVTVITLTRGRPMLLARAIASVRNQCSVESLQHLIIVDDCSVTKHFLETATTLPPNIHWVFQPRQIWEKSGPARSSRLRNWGVAHANSYWISMLDDDNEFEAEHIAKLLECADKTGCRAVHSWLQAFYPDGRPYCDPLFLWPTTPGTESAMYWDMVAAGVYEPGTNIFRDRADRDGVVSVDTGEWLLARELLLSVPYQEHFSAEDAAGLQAEDDKLVKALLARNEPIACNCAATLRYYIGGYSNNPKLRNAADFAWTDEKPQSVSNSENDAAS